MSLFPLPVTLLCAIDELKKAIEARRVRVAPASPQSVSASAPRMVSRGLCLLAGRRILICAGEVIESCVRGQAIKVAT